MGRNKRVLFCDSNYLAMLYDPWYKTGGATRQVVGWVEGLSGLGVDVKVLGAHSDLEFFRKYPHVVVLYDPDQGIPKLRYLYIRIPGLLGALVRTKPDYVYYGVPSPFAGLIAACCRCMRVRFILRVSNDYFVDERAANHFDPFRYAIFRMGYRFANYILCQNEYQFQKLAKRYPEKTFKIKNPYSGEIVKQPRPFTERAHVAWVGIFQYQKNLPLFLKIVELLPDITFSIAGGNDKRLKELDQQALDCLKTRPNVRMMGFLNPKEVVEMLDEAWLLLNTSHYEGFSNTFLESFSRGTPVYTFSQNDPDGIIRTYGLGGIFSNEREAQELINKAVREEEAFLKQSMRCLAYMKEHHELTSQCGEFLRLIGARDSTERHFAKESE